MDMLICEFVNCYCGFVFMLWGVYVQVKCVLFDLSEYCVLEVLYLLLLFVYCGFFGCCYFVFVNDYLVGVGCVLIDWCLLDVVEMFV